MRRHPGRAQGFSYLIVLFAVAALGAGLAVAGIAWESVSVQEKETELLFIGNAYRAAIASYYERGPGVKVFPPSLEQLVKDPRFPSTMRHLRALYRDPITGSLDWGLIPAPGGGIMGVYSLSEAAPRKRANFDFPNRVFEERSQQLKDKMTYREWQFAYPPGALIDPRLPQGGAALPAQ
jgi:type II secretory pathway pseudopilin PulG